ncbi:alpha/beta hydrolase family protein [Sphingomonas sp. RIT328]|uniref:alpha/beta hydrolase family protein n=1 Tax=Sphingomonas sp. RIT328 TaxID=1470591 RepID=UPI0004477C33|nr:S9 family peptidase [Sphingomonas sp. RIT328]EZP53358.1 Peptidase S9 prolyl oligopeptidase [Sphingomonas sp. RIT328]
MDRRFALRVGVAIGGVLAGAVQATADPVGPVAPVAAAFGAREALRQASLSPDGTHIAMIVAIEGPGEALQVADLATGGTPKTILRTSGNPEHLNTCHWSADTRIICQISASIEGGRGALGFSRTIAINSDGDKMKMLTAAASDRALDVMQDGGTVIDWTAAGAPGSVLMTRKFVPEMSTGTHLANTTDGLGVERIDTISLARHVVEPGRDGAVEYISDGRGVVRIVGTRSKTSLGYDTSVIRYTYRKPGDRNWQPLGLLRLDGTGDAGFNPYAVDADLNVAYGFADKDGRQALYKVALDGTLKRDLVLARPDVDVDGLIRIGRQRRVVGASYATERREAEFFDPALRTLAAALNKALPGQPLITFVDASGDEGKLLLHAGSDTDPGRYYVLDRASKHMAEVLPVRPQLTGMTLAKVQAIRFRAGDGTMIPGYLTLPAGSSGKGLPAIVMPHGGPGSRDEWGFDWLAQFYAARGFAVLQPNFRGSTGYGSAWFQKNGFQSWQTAIGDVNDAGRWLLSQGIAAPDKLAIVGWSYGGYAALQSAVLDARLYKAIVAIAPVTDLDSLREESRNYTDYAMVDAFVGRGPHVEAGSPARHADAITAPVLLFHGDKDRNVGVAESRLMAARLKSAGRKAELVEFPGLDHQLDDAAARTTLLSRSDAFLRASLGL